MVRLTKSFRCEVGSIERLSWAIKGWHFKAYTQPHRLACFHSGPKLRTDGVFRALTESRVRTPWIEALRTQQRAGPDPSEASQQPKTPAKRNLEPKRMSDSYHSVVSGCLGQTKLT